MNIHVLKMTVIVIALFAMLSASGCLGGDDETASKDVDTTNIGVEDTSIDGIVEIIEPPRDPTIFDSDLIIFMDEAVHTYDSETGAWVGYSAPIGSSTQFEGRILATFTKRTIYHHYENNNTWVPKNESVNLTWSFALSLPTGSTIGGTGTSERMYVSKHNATDGTKNDMPLIGSNVVEYDGKTVWYNTEGTAVYSAVKSGQPYPLLS